MQEFFCDWLTSRWFLEVYEHDYGTFILKVKLESHEKVKIHNFAPIQLKFCVQEFFYDWLTSRWFLQVYEHDLKDFYFESEIRKS